MLATFFPPIRPKEQTVVVQTCLDQDQEEVDQDPIPLNKKERSTWEKMERFTQGEMERLT